MSAATENLNVIDITAINMDVQDGSESTILCVSSGPIDFDGENLATKKIKA